MLQNCVDELIMYKRLICRVQRRGREQHYKEAKLLYTIDIRLVLMKT